jgi:hypothetical protein
MKRHRLPATACVLVGIAGSLALTACGTVHETVTQTGATASASASPSAGKTGTQAGAPAAASSATPARSTGTSPAPPAAAAESVVLFNCEQQAQVRPPDFILTCADAGSVLSQLSWTSWSPAQATATGVHQLNDCTPNCAEGKFRDYPAVITFWRSEPVAGHPGEKYFTRVTVRYTGPRPPAYRSNGILVRNPAQWTEPVGTWPPS